MSESRRITHEGPVFSVEVIERTDARGRTVRRDIVRHPGAVTIVPRLGDGTFIMICNLRASVDQALLEFPAGKLESNEDPKCAAARELEEETGFRAESLRPIGAFYTSPGMSDELMLVFEAGGLAATSQALEPGEEITVAPIAERELRRMIRSGEVVDGKTLAAFLLWEMNLGSPAARPMTGTYQP